MGAGAEIVLAAVAVVAAEKAAHPIWKEMIRRGQDRLRGAVPGGFNTGVLLIVAAVILVFWLFQSIYIVQPDERGVELRSVARNAGSLRAACTSSYEWRRWEIVRSRSSSRMSARRPRLRRTA